MTVTLTKRWGTVIRQPGERDLVAAFEELETPDADHAECWLSDAAGWTITAYEDGRLMFDNIETAEGPWHLPPASMSKALALSKLLIAGDLQAIREEPWIEGYGEDRYPLQQGLGKDSEAPEGGSRLVRAKPTRPPRAKRRKSIVGSSFAIGVVLVVGVFQLWSGASGIIEGEVDVYLRHGPDYTAYRSREPLEFWAWIVLKMFVAGLMILFGSLMAHNLYRERRTGWQDPAR